MIDLNYAILTFHKLLCVLWGDLKVYVDFDSGFTPREDWAQSNWEMLVEYVLQTSDEAVYLEVYGDGADCNGVSSRVTSPEKLSTHAVFFRSRLSLPINYLSGVSLNPGNEYKFERFVSLEEGWFFENPPFNYVMAMSGKEYVVLKLDEVDFSVKKIV